MTLEDKVHAFRLHLFRRAQELGNVTAACRELGVSRSRRMGQARAATALQVQASPVPPQEPLSLRPWTITPTAMASTTTPKTVRVAKNVAILRIRRTHAGLPVANFQRLEGSRRNSP